MKLQNQSQDILTKTPGFLQGLAAGFRASQPRF
jgi:hypothetical protein